MLKVFWLSGAAWLTVLIGIANAAPIGALEALDVAARWVDQTAVQGGAETLAASSQVALADPVTLHDHSGKPLAHVVAFGEHGFVVIAADTDIEPILFFSTDASTGCLADPRHPLRALLRADVPGRLAAARAKPEALKVIHALWSPLFPKTASSVKSTEAVSTASIPADTITIVQPPFVDTHWGQRDYFTNAAGTVIHTYNRHTPSHYPAGCGAVALAQILRWFEYPDRASDYQTITVNGSDLDSEYDLRFNYSQMPFRLSSSCTDSEINQVALLLSACGISLESSYETDETSSYSERVEEALLDVFGFRSAIHYYARDGERRADIASTLTSGYPVYLDIQTGGTGDDRKGHFVVVDGYGYYGAQEVYHINFGWRGYADGWYPIPILTDDYMYVNWSVFQAAIYHMRPPNRWGVDLSAAPLGAASEQGRGVREAPGAVWQQISFGSASPTSPARFRVTPKNCGTDYDGARFTCAGAPAGWTVSFYNPASEDVTAAVLSDGHVANYRRPTLLDPALYVALAPLSGTPESAVGAIELVCRSATAPAEVDAFRFQATNVGAQPDVLIRLQKAGAFADRAAPVDLASGQTARFDVLVVNAGSRPERFTVEAWAQESNVAVSDSLAEMPPGWSIVWSDAAEREITALLRGGWWRTDLLAAGSTQRFYVAISPGATVPGGQSIRYYFRARTLDGTATDLATGQARKRRYEPVLFAGQDADKMQEVPSAYQAVHARPATFYVRLANAGEASDAMKLVARITEPAEPSDWTVTVEHFAPSLVFEDITAWAFSASGWTVSPSIDAQRDRLFRVTVTPATGVPVGTRCLVSLSAASAGDPQCMVTFELETFCGTPGVQVSAKRDLDTDTYQDFTMYSRLAVFQEERYLVQIRNTGGLPESYVLRAAENADPAWVAYYYNGTNTTSSGIRELIVGPSGWNTGEIAGGETREYLVTVQPGASNLPNGSEFLSTLTATAQGDSSLTDSVALSISRALYALDARIRSQADSAYRYGSTSGRCGASPAVFNIQMRNSGEAEDSYLLRGSCWAPSGETNWSVRYFNGNTGEEITAAVTNAGWSTLSLPPEVAQDLLIEVLADPSLFPGNYAHVTLLADSSRCTSVTGGVTAVIEKAAYRPRVRVAPLEAGDLLLASDFTQTTRVDTVRYRFEVVNEGDHDFFDLQAELLCNPWECRFLGPEGDDWTAGLTNGMRVVMPAGTNLTLTAEMTPTFGVSGGDWAAMRLRATSVSDAVWWDQASAYAVRAVSGVDVRIKNGGTYGEESADADALPGMPGVYDWEVVNTGESDDYYVLTAWYTADDTANWSVRHYESEQGGLEVTERLAGLSEMVVGPVSPGQAYGLRSEAWPSTNLAVGATCKLYLIARAITGAPSETLCASNVIRRSTALDVAVRKAESIDYTNLVAQRVSAGGSAAFYIRVANAGPALDAFGVSVAKQTTNTLEWSVRWFDGAYDVSDALSAGSYVMGPIASGADQYLRLEVAPLGTNWWAGPMLLTVKAESRGDPSAAGSVRANTSLRLPLVITRITLEDGGAAVAVGWQSEPGISYALQGSDSLVPSTFTNLASGVVAAELSCTVTAAPPASARAFLRVVEETD